MQAPRNLIGQTLGGRYQVTELLGQGGMSAVYKAYDPNLQRIVAIKTIHSHLAHDPKFVTRFQEEATAVAKLRHPNIVQVFDFNRDEDLNYMVQEFVPGETLQDRLRRLNQSGRRMSLTEAVRYTIQICNALEYAHQRNLIHRDIKPANIMLDVNGDAILMDFGIVKIVGGQSHTASGAVVGTALYMPPELIRGEGPGPRSDMYSLGVTLFEMVSGRPPYEAESAMALMMMHINDPVPDLRSLRPEVPEDLIAVIEKSLAKTPAERFSSMPEMAAALKLVQNRLQTGTVGTTIVPSTPANDEMGRSNPVHYDSFSAQPTEAATYADPTGDPLGEPNRNLGESAATYVVTGANQYERSAPQPALSGGMDRSAVRPEMGADRSVGPSGLTIGGKNMPLAWLALAGIAVVLGALVCGAIVFLPGLARNADGTQEAALLVDPTGSPAVTLAASATDTPQPSDTPVLTPTDTPEPSSTPTPTLSPTPTIPVGVPYSRINTVTLDEAGNYNVEYETFEFTEALAGLHLVFYFETQPTDLGYMYGGPRPFAKFNTLQRPSTAGQICIGVSNADHSVRENSGNCVPLPDVVVAYANIEMQCLLGPGEEYSEVSHVHAGQGALVRGISADEGWWNVVDPHESSQSCWIQVKDTQVAGDISILPLAEAPVLDPVSSESLGIEITEITADDQGRFVVAYTTRNFQEQLPGTHIHFFYNTVSAEQVGIDGEGNRLMFGGPSPFTGFIAAERPAGASQICALVANPDHSVIANSGNCLNLPAGHSGHQTPQSNNEPKEPRDDPGGYDY